MVFVGPNTQAKAPTRSSNSVKEPDLIGLEVRAPAGDRQLSGLAIDVLPVLTFAVSPELARAGWYLRLCAGVKGQFQTGGYKATEGVVATGKAAENCQLREPGR